MILGRYLRDPGGPLRVICTAPCEKLARIFFPGHCPPSRDAFSLQNKIFIMLFGLYCGLTLGKIFSRFFPGNHANDPQGSARISQISREIMQEYGRAGKESAKISKYLKNRCGENRFFFFAGGLGCIFA